MRKLFNVLFRKYGQQDWWPVTDEGMDKPEYKQRKSLSEKQKLEIIIGSILTQNTSWTNAEKAIINLNKYTLIDINNLIHVKEDFLANIIKSAGYYNQKAERIKIMAEFLKNNPIQELEKLPIQVLRNKLLNIKGIGKETADSMILYAFNKPIFVVDAYTKRLFLRLKLIKESWDYDQIQDLFHKHLEKDVKLFQEYHALIVEHEKNRRRLIKNKSKQKKIIKNKNN